MKIKDILAKKEPTLSFEVFPPKTEDKYESVERAVREIASFHPSFMSVTYGAGGGTSAFTVNIAKELQALGVTPLPHLTCVSSKKEKVHDVLAELEKCKSENIMALRGDIPPDGTVSHDFRHASELIREIRESGYDFCIGAACYPEGHPESESKEEDISHLKEKVDAGADFLTTQMFFDNSILYNFLYKIRDRGITVPVIAGIMPVTNAKQMKRILAMSGTNLPSRFRAILDRFGSDPAAMQQAGIAYATEQIIDLIANGVNAIHIYTMNRPDTAAKIKDSLSMIIRPADGPESVSG